jgi:D-cysteine desulfhydrase
MARLRAQGRKPYYFPVGASVPLGVWAYVRCLEEILEQTKDLDVPIRRIYVAVGSGGTLAGLILGRALLGWKDLAITGVAVTSTEAFWKADLARLLRETCQEFKLTVKDEDLPINVTDRYVGEGYAIPYPEEINVIRKTGATEGVLLDPVYTGKAMTGLLDHIKRGETARHEPTVFIHTGGIFGIFPMREQFGL